MFLFDAPLTLREYVTHERVPLADIFHAVARLLAGRHDAIVFGAQAVNFYAEEERMTADIDVLSTDAEGLAEEIRAYLATQFHIATRVRSMTKKGAGFRVYQVQKEKNRSLVDVRQEANLPDSVSERGVHFVEPVTLLAMKIESYAARRNQIKGDTDRVDIRRMLASFPELRELHGEVEEKLISDHVPKEILDIWYDFVEERLDPDSDEY